MWEKPEYTVVEVPFEQCIEAFPSSSTVMSIMEAERWTCSNGLDKQETTWRTP